MASPKDELLAAIDKFDAEVKGDRRYSQICERLYEIRTDLDRMPDPRDEGESPGRRSARKASGDSDQRQGHMPPQFARHGATAQRGT